MKRRKKKTLKLNGLNIDIVDSRQVIITDKMSNCTHGEAAKICSYLFSEGFLSDKEEVSCEIIQS